MNRCRLLLIEKDFSLRMMIEDHLRQLERMEVEVAEDADLGIERAMLGQFDLIIASLHMPEMPPARLLESLASVRPLPVVIALSNPARLEPIDGERATVIWRVLPLPLTRATLSEAVLLALRHQQDLICRRIVPQPTTSRHRDSEAEPRRKKGANRSVRLGHYEITEVIGGGTKGTVYRGEDRRSHEAVALRAIPRELVERLGQGNRWFERFTREVSAASSVHHERLATILDHGFEEDQRCLFVVNELAPGPRLSDRLESEDPLSPKQSLKMAGHVASALSALHNAGLTHRLVRPTNVHLGEDKATLTDAGVVGMLAWELMPLRERLDRMPYLSPEQLRLQRVDDRSDQFALGLLLHEALTGRSCFGGETPSARAQEVLARRLQLKLDPEMDESRRAPLSDLLTRMLAPRPEERFQGDADLQGALERCAEIFND